MKTVTTAHLEALRTTALAALTSCQAVVQTVEALIGEQDEVEPDKPDWGTFDTDDTPTGATNGKSKARRR